MPTIQNSIWRPDKSPGLFWLLRSKVWYQLATGSNPKYVLVLSNFMKFSHCFCTVCLLEDEDTSSSYKQWTILGKTENKNDKLVYHWHINLEVTGSNVTLIIFPFVKPKLVTTYPLWCVTLKWTVFFKIETTCFPESKHLHLQVARFQTRPL